MLMVQTLVRRLFNLIDFYEAFVEVLNDDVLFMRSKLVVMVQTLVKRLLYLVIFCVAYVEVFIDDVLFMRF